jgi:hypothetical protein
MVAMALVQLLATAGALPVRIEGPSACPRPEEVERRLGQLLPAPGTAGSKVEPRDVVQIEVVADGVRVTLLGEGGSPLGSRVLPGRASCAERAAQVALAVATWLGEGHSDPTLDAAALPERERSPARPPAPAARLLAAAAPALPAASAFDLGAGVLASGSGSWAPGLLAVATWTPRARGAGLGGFGFWESRRTLSLAGGSVVWSRAGAGAGGHLRAPIGASLLLEAHAHLAVAAVALEGRGFSVNRRTTGLSPGAAAGVRLVLAPTAGPGALAGWAEAAVTSWLWRERALAVPPGAGRALPRSALFVSIGASVGRFRR